MTTTMSAPHLESRLPNVGTTIFTVMSALAQEHRAINLGQGFPDFGCDPRIVEAVAQAMAAGHNQYPPMAGVPALRDAIATKVERLYGRRYSAATEVTVTAGATQAILTAILCAVRPGDEVIVIEPAYDSYLPAIALAGGTPVLVSMRAPTADASFSVPWDAVAAAITPRTRMLLINSPHNPTGTTFTAADLNALARLTRGTQILVMSDEVYEHMVYDGEPHRSLCGHDELAQRAFVISSFGKTYHVTGWKVAYCVAPAALTAEFRKVHQFNVFTVNTPMQVGIADYMADPRPADALAAFYQSKRDMFRQGLAASRFRPLGCAGTYFQLADYSAISDLTESEFCRWLTVEAGVAAIPVSAFFDTPREHKIVRFCFAKRDETLQAALDRLCRL